MGDTEKATDILNQALEAIGETDSLKATLEEPSVVRTERKDFDNGAYNFYEYGDNGTLNA